MADRIKLNVGGKLFETTASTIQSGGSDSLLAALSNRAANDQNPIFIDRDPEIFSVLLSLLRSERLSSAARRFSTLELIDEAQYYGIESQLRSAMSPPPLSGIDASRIATISPASDGIATAFSAGDSDGSVWIAHGGQISGYDWNLSLAGTIRTHLEDITAIRRVWPEVAAVGSDSAAGLHFYDFSGSRRVGSAHWTDPADPRIYKARVAAIADSPDSILSAFECPHRENCVLEIDKSTLEIKSEIGRQSGSSTKRMVPGKLTWVPGTNSLVASAAAGGAFGYSGYIRIYDPRTCGVVWETNEPGSGRSSRFGDSFADVDVDVEKSRLYKICSKSGDLGVADMRKLGDDPWVYLEEKNPSLSYAGGGENVNNLAISCFRGQVFVARDGDLEVWSRVEEVEMGSGSSENGDTNLYRRNYVDKEEDSKRGTIRKIEGGGERLFVSRDGVEGVEVWESSNFSSPIVISSI